NEDLFRYKAFTGIVEKKKEIKGTCAEFNREADVEEDDWFDGAEKALGDDVHLATTAGGSGGGSGGAPKPKPVKPKSEEQKL
ncbi:unnamed protein product, partial [Durusdinium trenchii]